MTFNDLNLSNPLLKALDELGIRHPTTIQQKVFSVVMSGRDVCGIAQTGTGKTFAYLLPCLRLWKFSKDNAPQVLVIVPTRELVTQVVDAIKALTPYMSVNALGIYGGVNINTQKMAVAEKTDVIVATPGRLYDLILDGSFKAKSIRQLVIDEMDEMLNLGFRTQVKNILDLLPAKRQNLLFSATITPDVESIMDEYFNNPERVEAAPTGTPLDNIEQAKYHVPNFNTKVNLLTLLLQQTKSMTKLLVFTASRAMADELYERMESQFPGVVGVIHSNKEQNHRFNTVKQFKEDKYRFIIATDIVARGIDISEVTHVINFDLPDTAENYIHRIGRTGRADKKGIAISFVTEREQKFLQKIEALMKYEVPTLDLPAELEIAEVLEEFEKEVVHMKEIQLKIPKKEDNGAFHEKSAKNSKVNNVISRKDRMMKKYGKPKTRGQKKR